MISDFDQTCNNLCSHSVLLLLIAKDFIFPSILCPIIVSPIFFAHSHRRTRHRRLDQCAPLRPLPLHQSPHPRPPASGSAHWLNRRICYISPQCISFCRHSETDSPTVAAMLFSKTEFFAHFLSPKQMR